MAVFQRWTDGFKCVEWFGIKIVTNSIKFGDIRAYAYPWAKEQWRITKSAKLRNMAIF